MERASQLPAELTAQMARRTVDLSGLPFNTTADLEPEKLTTLVGQERALQALQIGLGVNQPGYHIFVSGAEGSSTRDQILALLQERAHQQPTPGDWVYVHNFHNPDQPQAIALDAGQGRRLQQDMERFLAHVRETLPKAFRQEAFENEQRELGEKYEQQIRQLQEAFNRFVHDKGFTTQSDAMGNVAFIPLVGDQPMSPEDIGRLTDEQRREIERRQSDVLHEFRNVMLKQRQVMQQLSEEIRAIERNFSATHIAPLISELKRQHLQPEEHQYLDDVQEHMLSHLDTFKESHRDHQHVLPPQPMVDQHESFLEYHVNVIVDNSDTEGAPVIVEDIPTYKNLFGAIDRVVDPHGRVVTNFTRIQAGSVLRASGGYVLIDLEDALTEPFVWKPLKRALQNNQIKIEAYDPFAIFTLSSMQPQPIPIQTKVVVLGRPWLFYLLYFNDPDFQHIFKIKADFGDQMPRTDEHQANYASFIARLCQDESLCHLDRSAVEAVIEHGMRHVGDQEKLASQFGYLADLIREACYAASQDGASIVSRQHVEAALQSRIFRTNRIEEQLRDMITDGTVLIDTEGERVGQVNGLSVIFLGDHIFGRPSRVTATTSMGRGGIVNIEREAKLSGSTHDKGVLILSGYLRQLYAQDKPLSLSASICFEQSYSGVDGDSASSTELYALLSRLSNLPLRQDLAVTGSVNQWGDVQAIGGVNEKIEGFYDVCAERGLTGTQGVIIPQSNVRNLMLRPDVVAAIEAGRFHVYPITHVDQGLEHLSGAPAGDVSTTGTVHYLVNERLRQLAHDIVGFGEDKANGQPATQRTTDET